MGLPQKRDQFGLFSMKPRKSVVREKSKNVSKNVSKSRKAHKTKRKLVKSASAGKNKRRLRAKSSSSSGSSSSSSSSSCSSSSSKCTRKRIKILEAELKLMNSRQPRFLVRPGDELLIPEFDPSDDTSDAATWVERVEVQASRYHWTDDVIFRLIAGRLKGNARAWYDETTKYHISWEEFAITLKKQFCKSVPFNTLFKDAALYEASPGQSLGDFCFQKLTRLRRMKLTLPDEYVIDAVIGSIPNDEIVRAIRAARCQSPEGLYAQLCTMGQMPSAPTLDKGAPKGNIKCHNCGGYGHIAKNCKKTPSAPSHSKAQPTFSSSSSLATVKCYNCDLTGHFAKNCTKARKTKCARCKRWHVGSECPTPLIKGSVALLTDCNANPNMYVKTAKLNDECVECLIDSGSFATLIKDRLVKRLGLIPETGKNVSFRGLDGIRHTNDQWCNVRIRIMEATAEVNALVVPDSLYMSRDLLIGRDYIDQDHIVLIKKFKTLTIKQLNPMNDCFVVFDESSAEVDFGELNTSERKACEDLIQKYNQCIFTSLANLGKTNAVKMTIKCVDDTPVVYHPYRLPQTEREILRKMIDELLENGIIRESTSPYASPVLLRQKKTGDYRMCVDFRKLNLKTIRDQYPLPRIEDQIDQLGGCRYFIVLDLASGFYQVLMEEGSIYKTAFVTPDGHYEFLRMPFGLTNAPATFQRLINIVLGALRFYIAFPYLDDIIIPAASILEALQRLELVLKKLCEYNLTLRLSKCRFFQRSVTYLGREISADGVRPSKTKVEAVSNYPTPTNAKQVRQFIGLVGYFRRFVKKLCYAG